MPLLFSCKNARYSKSIILFISKGISKTKTLKHFMTCSVTPKVQHKCWICIWLGCNIHIIAMLNSIVCCKDAGLYGCKLELFDMCQ